MRKLLSFFALLFVVLGARAQSWTAVEYTKYNHETIVYADLNFNFTNADISEFTIGAFVDGECRASVSELTTKGNDRFFTINVRGDLTADANKEITFKAYYAITGAEYELTAEPVVMFDGESHITPSNRVQLTLTAATEIAISNIEVGVGETVDIRDYLAITPEGASLPTNYRWNIVSNSYTPPVTVEGDNLTGVVLGDGQIELQTQRVTPNGSSWQTLASGYFTVVQHATAIQANLTELTLKVGDRVSFEGDCFFIESGNDSRQTETAYTLTPADATDQVLFGTPANLTILGQGDGSFYIEALAAGTTTVTLVAVDGQGNVKATSAPITVNVVVPVTEIQLSQQAITTSIAMGNLASRIQELITVLPDNATDKSYTITSDNPAVRIKYDGNSFVAYNEQEGTANLTITANDGSGVSANLTVYVRGAVTDVLISQDPLVVTLTSTDQATDITQQILDNMTPIGHDEAYNAEITLSEGGPVTGWGTLSGKGKFGNFTAQQEGTSTVSVTLTWDDWDSYHGTGEVPTKSATFSFDVQVVVEIPLTGFQAAYEHNGNGDGGILILTPVPANASFEPADINVQVLCPFDADDTWQNAVEVTLSSTDNNLLIYDVETPIPGQYGLSLSSQAYPNVTADIETIDVPDALPLNDGWQWRTNPYGDITAGADAVNGMERVFMGNNFYEARTQTDLLINDPSWGYFGTLLNAGLEQNSCFKIKMTRGSKAPSLLYDGNLAAANVTLVPGWNWVGYPYFYNHSLNGMFTDIENTFPEGLVIISKDGGSAEWNGQAWEGDLSVLKNHEGYLIQNPSNENVELVFKTEVFYFQPVNDDAAAPVKGQLAERRVWQYDASQFMNNMTMVATLPEITDPENYSIGAFVGDECRGEGRIVDGKAFITIHTDGGEEVNFRLYNKVLDRYFTVGEVVAAQTRLGSLKAPVKLHFAPGVATGVAGVNVQGTTQTGVYDLSGRRVSANQRGVHIQRMADGTVRKLLVK